MEEIVRLFFYAVSFVGGLMLLLIGCYTAYVSWIYWKFRHIPSPKRKSFLFGHIPNLKQTSRPLHQLYHDCPLASYRIVIHIACIISHYNFWRYIEVGSIFVVFFVVHVFVITLSPEDIKVLLSDPRNGKPPEIIRYFKYVCGERFLGNSMLTESNHDAWKTRRRVYDPAFHKSFLRNHIPQINACARRMVEKISNMVSDMEEDGPVPIKDSLHECTADVISQVAFGVSIESSQVEGGEEVSLNAITSIIVQTMKGIQQNIKNPIGFEVFHPCESRTYRQAIRKFRDIGRRWILKRKADLDSGNESPRDILTFMIEFLKSNDDIGVEDLVDDFTMFYMAGQETTATLLCFALILIHQNPVVLERLQNEVNDVVGDSEEVNYSHIQNLIYMEQVFKETLRLHPPISSHTRASPSGGIVLSGYHIPEGTLVTMVGSVLCHIPTYFPAPNVFNPDRFEKSIQHDAYVFFPFGVGQRTCIGRHLAMMEAKVILSKLLQTFSFKLPPNYLLTQEFHFIIQPSGDLPFFVTHRR